jgi:pimeloyl-ACP methyl ester carboxylesterase
MPTITLGDLSTYYEVHGEGEPVLLIHGLGSSMEDWEWQVPTLRRSFTVVTYDVRGHGKSGKPLEPYSMSQFSNDAAKLIIALVLGPVHVVGLGMGGMIALQLAVNYPDLVRSLVVVNSGPGMAPRTLRERLAIARQKTAIHLQGMPRIGRARAERLFPGPENASRRTAFVARWSRNDKRAYTRALEAMIGWSIADRLGDIDCRVLVLAADQDDTPMAWKREYAARMRNASLVVIPDARHGLPSECPDRFNNALCCFLSTVRIQ